MQDVLALQLFINKHFYLKQKIISPCGLNSIAGPHAILEYIHTVISHHSSQQQQ